MGTLIDLSFFLGFGFAAGIDNDDVGADDDIVGDDADDVLSLILFFDFLPFFSTLCLLLSLLPRSDLATEAISLSTLASSHRTWSRDLTPCSTLRL